MKALGYIRCSTDKQATEGVSLQNQRQRIEEYARFKCIELMEIIEDSGISGGTNQRDGFMALLDRITTGDVECVILYSLERVSRDLLTGLAFEKYLNEYGVQLHTADGAMVDCSTMDGYSAFVLKMLFAEIERRQIRERTRKALEYKRLNGKVSGTVPYGLERQGDDVVPQEAEQKVIAQVRKMYSGGMKVSAIQRELTQKKITTRTGKPWQAVQIQRLLDDYQGVYAKQKSRSGEVIKSFILEIA
jgi:site-specific DNA recombinase